MTSHAAFRRITVSTGFDAEYAAYYLQGVQEVEPSARLRFSGAPFADLSWGPLGLVLGDGGPRICIDSYDSCELSEDWLAWADVYGKVNLDPLAPPAAGGAKLRPLGPSFGVRAFGRVESLARALATFTLDRSSRKSRTHFSRWRRQYVYHPPERAFAPGESDSSKLFFVASLWREAPMANELRRRFVMACRRVPGVEFEGGFAPFRHGFEIDMPAFGDMRTPRRYPIEEFIAKLQRSAASFIVPGVHDCLTWRLGQSLALGKAVIATPLARAMPVPLEHGQNVHFVDGSEAAIQDALQKICGDATYRGQLEREARAYYDRYLAPKAVIGRLLAQI
jgi:hypothetical protein